jgi:hypothetical protein
MKILRPIMPAACRPVRENVNGSSSPLANMFEHLIVEETLEPTSPSKAEPKTSTPTKVRATVENTEIGRKQEASIASMCLSRDVHRLRGVVQKIWKDYHEGNMGLVAASITTNTAIDFCRKLQEDFEKPFPGQENGYERACTYCIFLGDTKTEDFEIFQTGGPCLATVHRILERFVAETKDDSPDDLPIVCSAHINQYVQDSPTGQEAGEDKDKFSSHFSLMMGVLPELCTLIRATTTHCERLHAEHEILRAMRYLLSCKKQTLWVTFAFQVFLDIRHIMREDITWAFGDLCRGSKLITSNIEEILQFSVDVGVAHLSRNQDQVLNQVLDQVRRWTEQDLVCILTNWARELGESSTVKRHVPPYYLLKRDPLWCGTLLYSFRMVAHEVAIATANSWSCILLTAHLYNGFRQSGLLTCRWEDMERIVSMHGAENLFVGTAPKTLPDSLRHLSLATGMRPSELAPNQRQKETTFSKLKWRRLKQLTPVSSLFKGRFCEADGRTDLGPNDVIKALRQKASEGDSEVYQIRPAVDLCDIIDKLGLAIEHETKQTTFSHFKMYLLCSKLLRQLHETVGPDIFMWSIEYRDDRSIPGIVLAILVEATKGRPVAAKAGDLITSFVLLNDGLAQEYTRTIDAVAESRMASASNGVADHDDARHLLDL